MARKRCVLCKEPIDSWGNNAEPLASGRCCDDCNDTKVIPARMIKAKAFIFD